jgi:hypothetical protein
MADPIEMVITTNGTNTIDSLNEVKADLNLTLPQPFKTESELELKPLKADLGTDTHLAIDPLKLQLHADPLQTDSNLSLDLKPAVIDFCFTTNIGKLPNVCIRQPYQHHFGFTWFGVELWGFSFSGQQETVIEDLVRHPKVVWGGARITWPPSGTEEKQSPQPPTHDAGGLRIRLGS